MKICSICKENKPITDYHKGDRRCKLCKKIRAKEFRDNNYFKAYCIAKKSECKRKGLTYDLTPEYLEEIWTGICPIFSVPILRSQASGSFQNSAHLDRFNPELGYTVGNVSWISGRANRIKLDATSMELRAIADWMERATTIPNGSTPEANAGGSA